MEQIPWVCDIVEKNNNIILKSLGHPMYQRFI